MRCGTLLLFAAVCAAAGRSPDETLARMRAIVLDEAERLPRYTCVQTVDRQFFAPTGIGPRRAPLSCREIAALKQKGYVLTAYRADRFRLEVRVGPSSEMYSWVGENRFGDRSLRDLLSVGPTSSGVFGPMLMNIFRGDAAEFRFDGEKPTGGRLAYAYSFRVPWERSHHMLLGRGGLETSVGYEGTILSVPETGMPVQLTVHAGDLPADMYCCELTVTLNYSRERIGASEFLLPKEGRQHFVQAGGLELENTIAFSSCREYRAEAGVSYDLPSAFGQPEDVVRKPSAPAPSLAVPAGRRVTIALTGAIDSAIAAGGDPFTGRLVEAIIDKRKKVIAPAGALVHGRIAMVTNELSSGSAMIHLRVESVEVDGHEIPFRLAAKRDRPVTLPSASGLQPRGMSLRGLPSFYQGYFAAACPGERCVIPAGFRTDWVTVR